MLRKVTLLVLCLGCALTMSAQVSKKKKGKKGHVLELRENRRYQNLVDEAHASFQSKKYEDAISFYKQALDVVPEDSYAKAKIEDIRIIIDNLTDVVISQQEAEEKEEEVTAMVEEVMQEEPEEIVEEAVEVVEEPILPEAQEPEVVEEVVEEVVLRQAQEPEVVEEVEEVVEAIEEPVVEEVVEAVEEVVEEPVQETKPVEKTEPKVADPEPVEGEEPVRAATSTYSNSTPKSDNEIDKSSEEFAEALGQQYPEGITERTYKKGNKTFVERIVVEDGKGKEYRKVMHNWGGIYYFRNGKSITKFAWENETEL